MATIEQNPVQQRIPRSRTERLADQATTAALYVTHPERSLAVRSPTADLDAASTRAGTKHAGLSNASAAAALIAHRKQEPGLRHTASVSHADRRRAASPKNEGYQYRAAMSAIKEQKQAATRHTRKRAESLPSEAARASASHRASVLAHEAAADPFDDLDKYMRASRIQNAHMNPKLFTATPPVAPEVEELRRKSILEAASMSMAKDIYGSMEKDSGLQRNPTNRSRRSLSISKTDPATLQHASALMLSQALNLQDVAEKNAAERLAGLEDENANYRDYYGVEPLGNRSSLTIRRRRGSNDTEQYDQDRSREIRTQMTTLRSRLNAVDQKRENDRASLLELARKNVDAAIQDMDKRIFTEAGDSVVMQKYLEERAAERAQQGIKDIDNQYMLAGRINIGGRKYIEMAEVENLARARLQPTFDEIDEIAETQRARELETRLDEEQRLRLESIEREREADIQAEEEKHIEHLKQEQKAKQELKSKEEKVWPWKRKSKHLHRTDSTDKKTEESGETNGASALITGAVAVEPEAQPKAQPEAQRRPEPEPEAEPEHEAQLTTQPSRPDTPTAQATIEETASQSDSAGKRESRFKNWFNKRISRRSSAPLPKENEHKPETQTHEGRTSEPAQDAAVAAGAGDVQRAQSSEETEESEPQIEHKDKDTDKERSKSGPLRSNPVTANDLNRRAASHDFSVDYTDGGTPTKYHTAEDSEEATNSSSSKQRERADSVHELPASVHEAKEREEKEQEEKEASEALSAPPSMGDVVNRRRASSSTVRESRFSEDL